MDPEQQYVLGQARPGYARLLADFEARSAHAADMLPCRLDLAYGAHPRQAFDWFPAAGRARATLAFLHAGYWQSRDKASFRWLAPHFTRQGCDVALVGYPLCPQAAFGEVVAAAAACVPALRALSPAPLVLAGHSAGAHLAVEAALVDDTVAAVVGLSGLYDLEPLVGTSVNTALGLDTAAARRHSPLFRAGRPAAPAAFLVGGDETPAFIDQSHRMHLAWRAGGGASRIDVAAGRDHFTLLEAFAASGPARVHELLQRG